MAFNNEINIILILGNRADFADYIARIVGPLGEVLTASERSEAIEKTKELRPDIILIIDDGSIPELPSFYRELRSGWISRHSSVMVVKPDESGDSYYLYDESYLDSEMALPPAVNPAAIKKQQFSQSLIDGITAKLHKRLSGLCLSLQDRGNFSLIWEQIPGLGSFERRQQTVLDNVRKAAAGGKIDAISVTDNPGGNPAIANEVLSAEILKLGIEPLVHMAFRDRSRNECESMLYQLAAMDIHNVLVLTGDYPSNAGFEGISKPVFDLDSVTGLKLIAEMNGGMEHEIMRRKTILAPTSFFTGVAFSPYKQEEAEVMGQYYKLNKKVEAGAGFVITQVGYDARKLHELQVWLKQKDYNIPAVASIYVLSLATARAMNANHVPGCVVTDKLLAEMEQEATLPDKGRQARLDRAAKMYAIVRGMGFSGASIAGQGLSHETVEHIIEQGEELLKNWQDLLPEFEYPQPNGFYLFQPSSVPGLNDEKPAGRVQKPSHSPIYYFSGLVHDLVFEPRSPFFKLFQGLARWADRSRFWSRLIETGEYWSKVILYKCLNCGDCALYNVAYLCPVSQCPKNQRNGPCGGSYQGWCEIYPNEKKCIWVRAYRRLKAGHRESMIGEGIVPPIRWSLWQTSSWLNYFNKRDHLSNLLLEEHHPRKADDGQGAKISSDSR